MMPDTDVEIGGVDHRARQDCRLPLRDLETWSARRSLQDLTEAIGHCASGQRIYMQPPARRSWLEPAQGQSILCSEKQSLNCRQRQARCVSDVRQGGRWIASADGSKRQPPAIDMLSRWLAAAGLARRGFSMAGFMLGAMARKLQGAMTDGSLHLAFASPARNQAR